MPELSLNRMKLLVDDGVVSESLLTEWLVICVDALRRNPERKRGHEHYIGRLLEAGADPNYVRFEYISSVWSGRSLLNYAVLYSRAGAVEALLAGGASVVRTGTHKQHVLIADAVSDPWRHSHRHGSGRIIPLLLRAGAVIPEGDEVFWRDYQILRDRSWARSKIRRFEYLHAVQAAGGFPAYARAHRSIFVAIFSRGTRLPTDVLPTIVEYWAHLGWYQYRVPAAAAGAGLDDGLDDDNEDVLASSSDDASTTVP